MSSQPFAARSSAAPLIIPKLCASCGQSFGVKSLPVVFRYTRLYPVTDRTRKTLRFRVLACPACYHRIVARQSIRWMLSLAIVGLAIGAVFGPLSSQPLLNQLILGVIVVALLRVVPMLFRDARILRWYDGGHFLFQNAQYQLVFASMNPDRVTAESASVTLVQPVQVYQQQ